MTEGREDSREYYLKIFEDFPALIWRAGLDMKCDYFNRTWLAFTGRTMEQELGDGWTQGVHPDDLDSCFNNYIEHFKARKPFSMFYRLRNRFGEYRWIKDLGRPFYGLQDEFLGFIGSCYDVTEERENERKLEELNRAKDTFFSVVAHDLSGPVHAIEVLTGILAKDFRGLHEAELGEYMQELNSASVKVSRFLNDILTWSYSQLQGIHCEKQLASARDLIEAAVEPLMESLSAKNLSFKLDVDPDLTIYADPHMVKTIVRNLTSNAIKFSPRGGAISISGHAKEQYALLKVLDHGIGMPARTLDRVFDLGSQRSRPGTEGETGSGLGLTLCKEFVEKNGGKVWVESSERSGSVFTVILPRDEVPVRMR